MEINTSLLQDIHTYLLRIRSINEELEESPKRLKRLQQKVTTAEKALADHHTRIKSMKVAINDREVSLKANSEQIKKYKRDLDGISSKKEFDALNIEIAALEKRNSDLEDEGLTLMSQVEEAVEMIPELENTIATAKADYSKVEAEHLAQLPAWQARLTEAKQLLGEKKKLIPEEWIKPFERLLQNEGADALAVLSGRSCSACYTDITAQQYTKIMNGQIDVCKNCGKMLYLEK